MGGGSTCRPRGRRTIPMPRRGAELLPLLLVVPVPWLQGGAGQGTAPITRGHGALQTLEHVATLDLPRINLDEVFKQDAERREQDLPPRFAVAQERLLTPEDSG